MSIRCMWCDNEIDPREEKRPSDRRINHAICADCAEHFVFQMGVPLQTFLDSLPAPIFVVGNDNEVLAANSRGSTMFKKEYRKGDKKVGGLIFECAHARLEEGCGRTIHCSGCALRRSIYHTFETGEKLIEVPATLHAGEPDSPENVSLLISTEKMGNVVLLRVDRVNVSTAASR